MFCFFRMLDRRQIVCHFLIKLKRAPRYCVPKVKKGVFKNRCFNDIS